MNCYKLCNNLVISDSVTVVTVDGTDTLVIDVPANATIGELSKQIIVTDEGGNTDTCLLTQAAGEAYLTVTKTSIELTYQGTAVSFGVESNTSWAIS